MCEKKGKASDAAVLSDYVKEHILAKTLGIGMWGKHSDFQCSSKA